jgi:hypothetical protein
MRTFTMSTLVLVLSLTAAAGQTPGATTTTRPSRSTEMRDTAKYVYERLELREQRDLPPVTSADLELAYQWSKRWMEAEIALAAGDAEPKRAAAAAHCERMLTWSRRLFQHNRQDVTGVHISAATYYLAEAELLLEQLGGEPNGPTTRAARDGR